MNESSNKSFSTCTCPGNLKGGLYNFKSYYPFNYKSDNLKYAQAIG